MFFSSTRIPKFIGSVLFVCAGFLTYGDSLLFEKIYLALLGFVAVLFIRDINIVSIIVISAAANLSSEILYPLVISEHFQLILKLLTYLAVCYTLYKVSEDSMRLPTVIVVGLCLTTECYWYLTSQEAPMIFWYVLLLTINLWVRHFLFARVFIMAKYFPTQYRSLNLDHTLYQLVFFYILLHQLVLVEYILRRVFDVSSTHIYYAAPYIFHGLTTYSALLVLIQGYILISKNWFKA
ncbi:hypothetical protein [Paraglaciecola sp. L1A13]|uniref:hypothetical protein n=1 Tax=Paraglaciecola sp. L1A13 TaxID=2686359 RepID=UPI00131D50C2|nr:hypothetical protein [Paraglaciecola sp. L1A13]